MEFRDTLLAAQRNQQQKATDNVYYKARFDPPKKEQKCKDKLSANIQKFLAKKEEEERQKKLEAQRKREELHALRDPKALRKIQKTLKVIKSANKSVISDAVDHEHTAVTLAGADQPDQDDYGYESQEAAAIYKKMMEKYSKMPDEPKFPTNANKGKRDLKGTVERVKHALQHEEEPVPHKRRRRQDHEDKEPSPPPRGEQDKRKDEKPKVRKPMPPPMDFNQLLKLAEMKKSEPLEAVVKKSEKVESEPERLMTKKQKREYEEEMERRRRRQERLDADRGGGKRSTDVKEDGVERTVDKERKPEGSGFGRIPKLSDKNASSSKTETKSSNKDKIQLEMDKIEKLRKQKAKLDKEKDHRERERLDMERLEKLKAERERIERDIERLNRDRLEKPKAKPEEKAKPKQDFKKPIDLKSQNAHSIERKAPSAVKMNGHSSQGKIVPNSSKLPNGVRDKLSVKPKLGDVPKPNGARNDTNKISQTKGKDDRRLPSDSPQASKPSISNSFDFDKHVSGLKNGKRFPPAAVKRKMMDDKRKAINKRRVVDDDSEYDSEMDDFIDDGEEELDYSSHIKEIFGYDKSKYRDIDDDDDPNMESSFSRQMREEYVSKKIGIMEDLEDIKLERKMQMKKKKRRISDD